MDITWRTYRRLDGTPVGNLFHVIAPADRVWSLKDNRRPVVSIPAGEKTWMFPPGKLNPAPILPHVQKWHGRTKYPFWRIGPEYATPNEWFAEVGATREAVLWLPSREVMDWWVERQMKGFVFVVMPFRDGRADSAGEVVAVIEPAAIYFPCNADTDIAKANKLSKWAAKVAHGKVALANASIVSPSNPRGFFPI